MKIKYIIDFGFAGCQIDGEEEFPDDVTEEKMLVNIELEEQIEEWVKEYALSEADNNLSWSWEKT